MLLLKLERGLTGGWGAGSIFYEFCRRSFLEESVVVVMGFLFSKRLVGDRLAMFAIEASFVFFGEIILLLSIRFWVYSLEDSMTTKNIVIKAKYITAVYFTPHSSSTLPFMKSSIARA